MSKLKSNKKLLLLIAIFIVLPLILPLPLMADGPDSCKIDPSPGAGSPRYSVKCFLDLLGQEAGYPIKDATGTPEEVVQILGTLFSYLLGLLGVLFVVLMIYAGILWMTAQGNDEQVKKAQNIFKNAVAGLALIVGAALIMFTIVNLLVKPTEGDLPVEGEGTETAEGTGE